jgi:pyrroloquinoline quinone (PQQ) biosynthesis protein C
MAETAQQLVERIRGELQDVGERLERHPYPAAVEAASLPRERLGLFAGQQQRIISSDLRSVGQMIHRYGGGPTGQFFIDSLATEVVAYEALGAFAAALGLDRAALVAMEPLPGALAYTHFVAWLSAYGSDAEFAAAFLVNLPAWGRNCGRMARALRSGYGMTDQQVAFFDLFAADAPGYEAAALAVIQRGLERGVEPRDVQHAARLLQSYELLFWDALWEASAPRSA